MKLAGLLGLGLIVSLMVVLHNRCLRDLSHWDK